MSRGDAQRRPREEPGKDGTVTEGRVPREHGGAIEGEVVPRQPAGELGARAAALAQGRDERIAVDLRAGSEREARELAEAARRPLVAEAFHALGSRDDVEELAPGDGSGRGCRAQAVAADEDDHDSARGEIKSPEHAASRGASHERDAPDLLEDGARDGVDVLVRRRREHDGQRRTSVAQLRDGVTRGVPGSDEAVGALPERARESNHPTPSQ